MCRTILFLTFLTAIIVASPVTVPLEAFSTAVNLHDPDSVMPFIADSFTYLDAEYPVSIEFLRNVIYLAPYHITSFENVRTKPQEGGLRVDADAVIKIGDISDVMPISFILQEQNGAWKILAVVEPSSEITAKQGKELAAVSTPIVIEQGRIFVNVEFADGLVGEMVIHNSIQKTVIANDWAEKLGVTDGKIPQIALCGIVREDFPVEVGKLDVDNVMNKPVVGAIGADFIKQYIILLDIENQKLSLIDRMKQRNAEISLERFGIITKPEYVINLLAAYPFNAVSVNLGFGFEAPMAVDISAPEMAIFSDFFDNTPGLKVDDDVKKFIADHPGRMFTHKYVSVGKIRRSRIKSRISDERKLCEYEFPKGIAGIINASFFGGSKIMIDMKSQTLSIF